LRWSERSVGLALSEDALQQLLADLLGPVDVATLDETLLGAVLHDIAMQAGRHVGLLVSCELRSRLGDSAAGTALATPRLRLRLTSLEGQSVWVWIERDALPDAGAVYARVPPCEERAHLAPFSVPARLEIGWVSLTAAWFAALRVGDAIFAPTLGRPTSEQPLLLRLAPALGIHCHGQTDGRILTLTGITVIHDDPLADWADEPNEELPEQPEGLFNTLPVKLTFDLGTHALALGQLQDLAPGQVFDLDLRPESAVTLRVNGVRVGRGELVDVDGRVGVAITQLERSE
jgi:type III secretion system YscQ/HrcQ family protein